MRSAIERDGGVNAAKAKLSSGIIDHRWHHEVGRVHTVLVPPQFPFLMRADASLLFCPGKGEVSLTVVGVHPR